MGAPLANAIYEFGDFRLDARRRLLLSRRGGDVLPLPAKALDALLYLVQRAGELVDKPALLQAVWPNVSVEENSVSQVISALRRSLGESPSEHRYIVTAPGRGYRFIADVEIVPEEVDTLTSRERDRMRRRLTQDAQAYQLYVTGWSALTKPSSSSLARALGYLEQAVARDPSFALAHACLADCYAVLAVFGGGAPHEVFPKAIAAVTKALEIDPELAEAHAELGHIHLVYELDLGSAEREFRRALAIDPESAMAHHYMGLLWIARGDLDRALASVRRAQARAPLALNFNANVGMILYYARRYEEAVTQLETTLGMDAAFDHARSYLGRACLRLGDFDRAIAEFQSRSSTTIGSTADLPSAYALAGRTAEAEAELERLLNDATRRFVSAYDLATVHAALGDREAALDSLERAIEQRAQPINFLGVDPAFDALRRDARFERMVARLIEGNVTPTKVGKRPTPDPA